jgi:hypothetical protein
MTVIVSYIHQLFLKAHSAASKADNPSWHEATRGKFADEYWEAMKLEVATLENIDVWSAVDHYDSNGAPHHLYQALGHSIANVIQMDALRSSKHVSVLEAMNNWKGLTSLRPMPQLFNGPLYG